MTPENTSFHSHHSPMGALASFTIGAQDAEGGMGLELGNPFQGAVSVGYQDGKGKLHLLPFFKSSDHNEAERYVECKDDDKTKNRIIHEITREYLWATDSFKSPEIQVDIMSPFFSIPDPETADQKELAFASCPAIQVRVTFKNDSDDNWKGFFALDIDKNHKWTPIESHCSGVLKGATSYNSIGLATRDQNARGFLGFDIQSSMNRQYNTPYFLLGTTAGLEVDVPAHGSETLNLVLGFYKGGVATYNREMSYYYTQHFTSLIQVMDYALEQRDRYLDEANKRDEELANKNLSDEQKFLIAHATRSYYGSTQWLWNGSESVWVVNEGEYLMMNTFDLTVDMIFFEMRFNPWTVKNELDQFVDHYSYYDQVFDPADPEKLYPGGISFTHDMGIMNQWSPSGMSSYELGGLDRLCHSYMTCEQLCNWVLCAGVYIAQTEDDAFLRRHLSTLQECLKSLLQRDHHNPELRNGIMSMESSKTHPGGEITTYDSLDHSLGQSRDNIYLGGKMWASFVILNHLFKKSDLQTEATQAEEAALRSSTTITNAFNEDLGYIPAILNGDSKSTIIPAIEALVYPYEMGLTDATSESGPYGKYIKVLQKHLKTIMTTDLCLYEDGGWKLSSSADNSWMSKISLCQYVAREILGFDFKESGSKADLAHARWQREGSKLSACSDQFRSGVARGSLYYPRIVTNILWMKES